MRPPARPSGLCSSAQRLQRSRSALHNHLSAAGKTGSHIWTEAVDDPALKIGMIQTFGSDCGYILEPDKQMQLTVAFECDKKETGGGKLTCASRIAAHAPSHPVPSSPREFGACHLALLSLLALTFPFAAPLLPFQLSLIV